MRTKTCTKCGDVLPDTLDAFGPARGGKLTAWCRPCHRAARRAYRKSPVGRANDRAWRHKAEPAAKRQRYAKKYRRENRDALAAKRRAPDIVAKSKVYREAYAKNNREELRRKKREFCRLPENKERAKRRLQDRLLEYKDYMRKYLRKRYRQETWVRFNHSTSSMLRAALFQTAPRKTPGWWEVHCGFTVADLRAHLERQFTAGMTWDNYGAVWEIDHIEPLSKYRIASVLAANFKMVWGMENLRPLLKHLNRAKSARPASEMVAPEA